MIKPFAATSTPRPLVKADTALVFVKYKLPDVSNTFDVFNTPDVILEIKPFAAILIPAPAVMAPIDLVFVKYKLEPSTTFDVVKIPVEYTAFAS